MEKILLAINSHQINNSVIGFAHYIAKLSNSKLTGIFIEETFYDAIPEIDDIKETSLQQRNGLVVDSGSFRMNTEQGILFFKDGCMKEKVRYEVFKNHGSLIEDVIFESRFADLLIIDPETIVDDTNDHSFFAKEILARAECPVILPPISFKNIDEIIFCYDGSRSSVFAMKQFTYLFPQFSEKKIIVLEVNEDGVSTVYEKEKVRDLLKGHYSQIGFQVLNGDPTIELFTYLLQKKNSFVVMGAYGRKIISNIITRSRADLVLRITELPLFITHM
jgi:hypothetical protein